ncbi:MAG: ATP-binding protein [Deltaproteobacteria bacterium]|nr:ATP-binding protein [Deltaproteobacteria bacterium]
MMTQKEYPRIVSQPKYSFFLFGPRGVGKSSWLRKMFPETLYINLLEEKTYQTILADPEQFTLRLATLKRGDTVVLDEIQRLPNLLNEIHRHIEERGLRFVMSGSSARKLRRAGTNLLGGRAIRKELFPLTREELGEDFTLSHVMNYGSLPLIWTTEGDREVLETYVQTYLKEEIQAEALVRNLPGFARFLPVAALFNSSVLNAAALSRDAGVSRTTVLGYLDILDDTLLTFRLPAYEGRLRVKEKRHPKLYWSDPGIVRATKKTFGPPAPEEYGHLFESWLVSVLRAYRSYRNLFDDWNYWAPTENSRLEVDLLLWRGKECLAIDIKSSKKYRSEFSKGLRALNENWKGKKPTRNVIIYLGSERLKTSEGFEVLPLTQFLDLIEQGQL